MPKLIIALAGEIGCGKGAAARHLEQKYGAETVKFSDVLRDVMDRLYIPQSRENFHILSPALRQAFGQDILSKAVCEDAKKADAPIVILDGARRSGDLELFRQMPEFKLVYIEADPEKTFQRLLRRGENVGERELTFDQFQKQMQTETESHIRQLKEIADDVLENNGTFDELNQKLDEIIKKYQ